MINCFKDTVHALMTVLLSSNDDDDDGHHVDDGREKTEDDDVVEDGGSFGGDTIRLTSILRKVVSNSNSKRKKVQWVDVMGVKELAEIREFEPCEEDDVDRRKNCVCVIL